MSNQNLNSNLKEIKKIKALAGSIAHEVRNPLSTIVGVCDLMSENLNQLNGYLDLIANCSNRGILISQMILNNINDDQINKKNFTQLSISNIIQKSLGEFAFDSQKQRDLVNIDLRDNFYFKGNETLMIFVLFNLLKNALYKKAEVSIWLNSKKRTLYFKDNGREIPENDLNLIFDDFFTVSKKGGTGLGLPFCRRVMRSFGGDISCKSSKLDGVEFSLVFCD